MLVERKSETERMPSAELLGAVFGGQVVRAICMVSPTEIEYKVADDNFASFKTIYELQHLIKEWAKGLDYFVWSGYEHERVQSFSATIYKGEDYASFEDFLTNSEFKSVVLAGEWIVDKLSKDK